jgi:hypothetical protein
LLHSHLHLIHQRQNKHSARPCNPNEAHKAAGMEDNSFLHWQLLYVPPGFIFKNFTLSSHCVCAFCTNRLLPNSALTDRFHITEVVSVYCAVRTEPLYKTGWFHFWRVKHSYNVLAICQQKRLLWAKCDSYGVISQKMITFVYEMLSSLYVSIPTHHWSF